MSIKYLDAKRLRRVLIGGGNWLKKHEEYLNELNVYPVPDGDTGTNMAMTVDMMIKDVQNLTDKKTNMHDLTEIVEEALLMGARGNSGTIFSQIVTGFLKSIKDKKKLLNEDISIALKSAKEFAYKAVDTPVEGTILTVIREVSEEAEKIYSTTEYLDEMVEKLVSIARIAVDKTPELLPKLKEAGVIDSGALGLFYFFEGIYKTITEINMLNDFNQEERAFNKQISNFNHDPGDIKFEFCTEFIVRTNDDKDYDKLKEELLLLGDSAVFAKSSKKFKTHIHTNNPDNVIQLAMQYGMIEKVKVENMKLQNEELVGNGANADNIFVNNRKSQSQYAFIAVADTEELKDKFLKLGASIVILGGQGKNPSVQDFFLAISKITEDKQIVILPNNKNIISTAKLVIEKTEQNVLLQETRTMLEGYFYLMYMDEPLDKLKKDFEKNNSIEITRAVRNTRVNGLEINIDDYIAIVNSKIEFVNKSIVDLFESIKEKYIVKDTINVTIVEGKNKFEELDSKFEEIKQQIYGFLDIIPTSQTDYNYYILIENSRANECGIAVVTDSACDLEKEDIKDYPIYVVPLKVEIDGETYLENVDYSKKELWDKINNGESFKTSQPSPKSFINMYNKLIRKGYKKILSIHLSRGVSGTLQTVNLAKDSIKYPQIIDVIDSKTGGLHLGMLVLEVAKKCVNNEPLSKINEYIQKFVDKSKQFMYMSDVSKVSQNSRISSTMKNVASFFNIKPVVTMKNGKAVIEKKAIGETSAVRYIEKEIIKMSKEHSVYITGSWGGTIKMRELLMSMFDTLNKYPRINVLYRDSLVSSAVGTHSGPILTIVVIPRLL